MRQITPIKGFALALALVAALTVGSATAAPRDGEAGAARQRLDTVAVAIGQLLEDDGGRATIDLRAHSAGGQAGGALRFFCPVEGYYNGAVQTLSVENGAIKATGGGGLVRPDGTRWPVRYTAAIAADGSRVEIVVTGRDGFKYTMAGRLDSGVVRAGDPRALVKPATGTIPTLPHKH
jgi:hypothetical protein